jgi:hypothetical protein
MARYLSICTCVCLCVCVCMCVYVCVCLISDVPEEHSYKNRFFMGIGPYKSLQATVLVL